MNEATTAIVIEPNRKWIDLRLPSLWEYRELLLFLAWRDLKARYAQTTIGLAWALLQPLAMMVVFTIVFGKLANIPSDGLPYPIFAYAALVPWTYLAKSLDRGATSVVSEANLVTKVYFPRMIVPVSAVLGGLVDLAISFFLLFLMMAWYGVALGWQVVMVPLLIAMTVATALAVTLWLAALYVQFRDVGAVVPLLTQLWMFGSPIVYPLSMVPDQWRTLYSLNPMVGLIEGYRWALLGTGAPDLALAVQSLLLVSCFLLSGLAYFNRVERTFADII